MMTKTRFFSPDLCAPFCSYVRTEKRSRYILGGTKGK